MPIQCAADRRCNGTPMFCVDPLARDSVLPRIDSHLRGIQTSDRSPIRSLTVHRSTWPDRRDCALGDTVLQVEIIVEIPLEAIGPISELLPNIKAGNLRALGITTRTRSPQLPEVPPIDAALPGYDVSVWSGLMVPAQTPPDVVAKINAAVNKLLQDPEVQKTIIAQGAQVAGGTAADFNQMIAVEVEKADRLVKISGAAID